jgi:hypothetical protein
MPSSFVASTRTRRTYPRTPVPGRARQVVYGTLSVGCHAPVRQPRRLFLYALGAFGAAGAAVLLSSGTAHAQTPTVPVAPVPVRAPAPVAPAPKAVKAVVRETVRTLPSQPSKVPIVGEVVDPVLDAAPIPLPVVPGVLPLRALRTVEAPIAPSSTDRLRSAPVPSTASRSLAPSRVRAQGRDRVRPLTATSVSDPSAPAPSGRGAPPFDSRGGPPGVSADAQTHGGGGRAAASMAAVVLAVASGWRRFDFASGRAPRPGIAFDLSPPG